MPFCYQSRLSGIGETAFHDAASVEVGVSVEGIEPGMSLRATVDLAGEQVLEDTLTLRSSLVERSLPLRILRRGLRLLSGASH